VCYIVVTASLSCIIYVFNFLIIFKNMKILEKKDDMRVIIESTFFFINIIIIILE